MPLTPFNLTPDIPSASVCRDCCRRRADCHATCDEYVVERITAIVAQHNVKRRRQLERDVDRVIKSRYKRGLYE